MNEQKDDNLQETTTTSFDNEQSNEQEFQSMSSFMPDKTTTYRTKKDLYDDNYSSAIILLLFGVVGIILLVLNYMGIISIFFSLYQYTVGLILFIVFILIAFYSFHKAKVYKNDIAEEDSFTTYLQTFLKENVNEEILKSFDTEGASEEENYLSRISSIKNMIIKQYGNLDDNYLDSIIEDYYNENF